MLNSTSTPLPGSYDPSPSSSNHSAPRLPSARPSTTTNYSSSSSPAKPLALGKGGVSSFGGARKPSTIDDILADEVDPWGDSSAVGGGGNDGGDLIDVEDDAGDWGMFEEAPVSLFPDTTASTAVASGARGAVARVGSDEDDGWDMDGPTSSPPPPPPPTTSQSSFSASSISSNQPRPKPTPKPTATKTASAPKPRPVTSVIVNAIPSSTAVPSSASASSSTASTPVNEGATPATVSLAGLSKEEKEKEMARRREERKARIAGLKKGKA